MTGEKYIPGYTEPIAGGLAASASPRPSGGGGGPPVNGPASTGAVLAPLLARVCRDHHWQRKAGAHPVHRRAPLTDSLIEQHLNGGAMVGACFMSRGSSTTRGALLDLDSHHGETAFSEMQRIALEIMAAAAKTELKGIPFKSSGGRGIHILFLWNAEQEAFSVREALRIILAKCNLTNGTKGVAAGEVEIFPKSDSIAAGGWGSMVILPLAGRSCALSADKLEDTTPSFIKWKASAPVEVRERPVIERSTAPASAGLAVVKSAIDSLPNAGTEELAYDQWFRIVCAVHHATGGSDEGLQLVDDFSARSSKHDPEFLEREWRRPRSKQERLVTVRTLYATAAAYGWQDPTIADAFEVTPPDENAPGAGGEPSLELFYAYLPDHKYIYRPGRSLWPAASVDGHLRTKIDGLRSSAWLDQYRAVNQMTWWPGRDEVVRDAIAAEGGWIWQRGAAVYNLYRPPAIVRGNSHAAGRWRDHLRKIYPGESEHIERWLAQRVQFPGVKINHALVLGGAQGIGKDTLLEPVKRAVGPWNWSEISPAHMLGAFNSWVKAVVVRVSEARDLGDVDRFAFYDHSKTYIATPPDVLPCNEKHIKAYPVVNVMGVIITTNHLTDGIYLPADDRRHFVAWSACEKSDFDEDYWTGLWQWFDGAGAADVAAFLKGINLSEFNPKAPPPKTEAFYAVVTANSNPEDAELAALIERLGRPPAITIAEMQEAAAKDYLSPDGAALAPLFENGHKSRRRMPHVMERAGYVPVRNPDAADGLWKLAGRRQAIYGRKDLPLADQLVAIRVKSAGRGSV